MSTVKRRESCLHREQLRVLTSARSSLMSARALFRLELVQNRRVVRCISRKLFSTVLSTSYRFFFELGLRFSHEEAVHVEGSSAATPHCCHDSASMQPSCSTFLCFWLLLTLRFCLCLAVARIVASSSLPPPPLEQFMTLNSKNTSWIVADDQ